MVSSAIKLLFVLFVALLTACSFSKDKDRHKGNNPIDELAKGRQELRDLVFLANKEDVANRLKDYSHSKINYVSEIEGNLLEFILDVGTEEKLSVFVEKGLSVFLPNRNLEKLKNPLKSKLSGKYKLKDRWSKLTELNNSSEMLRFMQSKHDKIFLSIYELIREKKIDSARAIVQENLVACGALVPGLLLTQQLQSMMDNSKIFNFFASMNCGLKDVSREDIQFLWKIEVLKQFSRKFEDLRLLKEIREVYDSSYYTMIDSLDMSVGLRTIVKLSKLCEISVSSGKKSFSCRADTNEVLAVDEVVGVVLGFKNTVYAEYVGSNVNYPPPLPLSSDGMENMDYVDFNSEEGMPCSDEIRTDAVYYQIAVLSSLNGFDVNFEICEEKKREN